MKQLLKAVLVLSFVAGGFGKRMEFLRINQAQSIPKNGFIPVYSAIKDFPDSYLNTNDEENELVLLEPIQTSDIEKPELRNFEATANIDKPRTNNFKALFMRDAAESRNKHPIPAEVDSAELRNFQDFPINKNPELRNVQPLDGDATSSGRSFKHFLLLKSLLGTGGGLGVNVGGGFDGGLGGGYGGGGNFGSGLVYPIIINTPVNVTNLNNNTLRNTPAAAGAAGAAAAQTGNAGGAGGFRINYIGIPQTPAFPMQIPTQSFQMPTQVYHQEPTSTYQQPTPVYQQRQAFATAQPTYAVAMLNIPGTSSFMPISLPQYQSVNRNSNEEQVRRNALKWSNASKQTNPWSAFTNNLRGLQFL